MEILKHSEESLMKRSVKDIWKALKLSCLTLICTSIIMFFLIPFILIELKLNELVAPETFLLLVIGTSITIALKVFFVYEKGISLEENEFSFPASDVENTIVDILTLKRLRGLFYREVVNAESIKYVTNDFGWKGFGGNKNRVYGLNIVGDFGSRTIRFNSKQKRDEARYLLRQFSDSKVEMDFAFN
jgi:hypothetical protein